VCVCVCLCVGKRYIQIMTNTIFNLCKKEDLGDEIAQPRRKPA
jgi:hypothetical protein